MPEKLTWLDRFFLGLAPEWGLKRIKARHAANTYEAAGGGRRAAGWHRSAADANASIRPALTSLRELSRDLRRNNGWARRGIQAIKNNTVSWGIQPQAAGPNKRNLDAALAMWKAWAGSTHCDHDGRLNFYGLQRLVMETVVESGEALVLRQPANDADGLPVPLRLQVLEPDYLSPLRDGVMTDGGGVIIQGVEFDKYGRRVAYHLYTRHPGSSLAGATVRGAPFSTIRVPAENVLHVYQIERPGQVRGVPWLATAIARLNDFDDFEDAQLMQQKVAACFGAFVTDMEATNTAIGEQDPANPLLETVEPGQIQYVPMGKQITFATPPQVTDTTFSVRNLRRVAASLGVTYEDLTGDYSQVNYSSARMGRLAHAQNIHDWRWNMLIPQFCDGAWTWFMELAAGLNDWRSVPGVEWTCPPLPMLEPDKEAAAYKELIRNGIMTLPEAIREQGQDPDAQLAEISDTNKKLDELKLVLDCDPRQTSVKGQVQPPGVEDIPGKTPAAAGLAKPANGASGKNALDNALEFARTASGEILS